MNEPLGPKSLQDELRETFVPTPTQKQKYISFIGTNLSKYMRLGELINLTLILVFIGLNIVGAALVLLAIWWLAMAQDVRNILKGA